MEQKWQKCGTRLSLYLKTIIYYRGKKRIDIIKGEETRKKISGETKDVWENCNIVKGKRKYERRDRET